ATGRREDLLADGVIDYPMLEASLDLTGDGDRKNGETVEVVRSPIERVDDPEDVAFSRASALLGQKSVVGIVFADELEDLALGRMIDFADEIVAPLGGDRQRLEAVEAADDDFTGGAGGPDGDIEKRVHGKIGSFRVSDERAGSVSDERAGFSRAKVASFARAREK